MSGQASGSGTGNSRPLNRGGMRGFAYIDQNTGADASFLYTQKGQQEQEAQLRRDQAAQLQRDQDEKAQQGMGSDARAARNSRNRMKGWTYVPVDGDDVPDVPDRFVDDDTARGRRERDRRNEIRDGKRVDIGDGDRNGGVDTAMGGMDDNANTGPAGSLVTSAPLPTPPNLTGLPAPNQPNALMPVPRAQNGRLERRSLNTEPNVWWNQAGQEQTNPPSDFCWECQFRHKACDLFTRGYPCTRCEQVGTHCRNGLPSAKWERRQIAAQAGVNVPTMSQNAGGGKPPLGSSMQGRRGGGAGRSGRMGFGSGDGNRSMGSGNGYGGPNASSASYSKRTDRIGRPYNPTSRADRVDRSQTPYDAPQSLPGGLINTRRPFASSSRPEREDRPQRARSASPERYIEGEDDEGDEDDDDGDADDDSSDSSLRAPRERAVFNHARRNGPREPFRLSDDQFEAKWGRKRKCKSCTQRRVTCPGDRPCDRCIRAGRDCEPVYGEGGPYILNAPLRGVGYPDDDDDDDEDDDDDDDNDGNNAAAGPSTGRRRPGRRRKIPGSPVDPTIAYYAQFNRLFNPFNNRGSEMMTVVPTSDTKYPLQAPRPPVWQAVRDTRLRNFYRDWPDPPRRNWYQQAENMWFTNASRADGELHWRAEALPYNVNRPSNPFPSFGRNMGNNYDILNAQIPGPPHGDQIPWIATWNFEQNRTVETRGPLGWPYPSIDPLEAGHTVTGDGTLDPVLCSEDRNAFVRNSARLPCEKGPAMMCDVWPEFDAAHPYNPWYTCTPCKYAQWDYYAAKQHETLQRQKLFVCQPCATQIRKEKRGFPKECLCYASKVCKEICHLHRERIEKDADVPILIAEEFLIRIDILQPEIDYCINCGVEEANRFCGFWSCKLCREWVQDYR